MNTSFLLQKAVFSNKNTKALECLYFRNEKGIFDTSFNRLKLIESDKYPLKLSLNTFFGAFPMETWYKNANIKNVILNIKAKGKFILNLIITNGYEHPQKIESMFVDVENFENLSIEINIEDLPFIKGILYPEFIILNKNFEIEYIKYKTKQKPLKDVKLAIIMPTYKREKYVKNNLSILENELFSDKNYNVDIFVIDNGQTLDIQDTKNIKIIKSPNYGGAGGFTRGIIEVLDKDYSHVFLNDDDTLYEVESIKRLINFFKYTKENVVVGGGMFNFGNKNILNEQGAFYIYMRWKLLKHNLNMCLAKNVIKFTIEENTNYFGWWFFACNKNLFNKFGLPLPIFFRGDDQEFGIRIKNKVNFVSLLGVAIWHKEFYKKDMPLVDYYIIRNCLILSILHEKKSFVLIKNLLETLYKSLLTYRYERAKFIIKGIEDFLKGPEFLINTKPDKYHQYLQKEQKKKLVDVSSEFVEYKFNLPIKIKRFATAVTFNGHLLPYIFIKKGENSHQDGYIIERLQTNRRSAIFRKETVLYYEPTSGYGIKYKINKKKFFFLLFKGLYQITKLFFNYEKLQKRYKKEFKYLTSLEFWKKYLNEK